MAITLIENCYEDDDSLISGYEHEITQDLMLRQLPLFNDQIVFDLAYEAEAYKFINTTAVQGLVTDLWYERINPYVSTWKVSHLIVQ